MTIEKINLQDLQGHYDSFDAVPKMAYMHPSQGRPLANEMMANCGGTWGEWFECEIDGKRHRVRWSEDTNEDGTMVVFEQERVL